MRCAQQVALRRHTVVSSICKNKVLNILSYLRNYWANRPECQRVVLSRLGCADYTVVYSICKNKVLNILSYLRNYWANRPERQRFVLSRLGCADAIFPFVNGLCHPIRSLPSLLELHLGSSRVLATRYARVCIIARVRENFYINYIFECKI